MWQDYVIAAVIVMFTLTTVPLIRNKVDVPLATSIPMAVGSFILAVTYVTMNLWLSEGVEIVSFILWLVVVWRVVFVRADRS